MFVCNMAACVQMKRGFVRARMRSCAYTRTSARLVVAGTQQRSVEGIGNAPSPTCFIINMREELVPEPSDSSSFLWRSVGAFNSACAFVALI